MNLKMICFVGWLQPLLLHLLFPSFSIYVINFIFTSAIVVWHNFSKNPVFFIILTLDPSGNLIPSFSNIVNFCRICSTQRRRPGIVTVIKIIVILLHHLLHCMWNTTRAKSSTHTYTHTTGLNKVIIYFQCIWQMTKKIDVYNHQHFFKQT